MDLVFIYFLMVDKSHLSHNQHFIHHNFFVSLIFVVFCRIFYSSCPPSHSSISHPQQSEEQNPMIIQSHPICLERQAVEGPTQPSSGIAILGWAVNFTLKSPDVRSPSVSTNAYDKRAFSAARQCIAIV